MEFRLIPAGRFLMGSPKSEEGRDTDERQRWVQITDTFYLANVETTRSQWNAVMINSQQEGNGELPVAWVSYEDAFTFCTNLSNLEGRRSGLPSESEWEYACRAGSTLAFGGSGNLKEMGWTYLDFIEEENQSLADDLASIGGRKSANAWGLYDMHGNLKEWTRDIVFRREAKPDLLKPGPKAKGPAKKCRIVRGGSLVSQPESCRSAYRDWEPEDTVSTDVGFRVLLEIPTKGGNRDKSP
jgi:formylglycine-generating enzyme required for sulfatase activity